MDYVLHGDLKDALKAILPHIKKVDRTEWLGHIQKLKENHPLDFDNTSDNQIKPQDFIDRLYRKSNGKSIITTDVGQHQMWAAWEILIGY